MPHSHTHSFSTFINHIKHSFHSSLWLSCFCVKILRLVESCWNCCCWSGRLNDLGVFPKSLMLLFHPLSPHQKVMEHVILRDVMVHEPRTIVWSVKSRAIGTDGRPLIIHIRMKITNTAFVHHIQSETKEGAGCYSSEHLCWEMRRQMFAFSAFLFKWIYPQNIVAGKAKRRANNFISLMACHHF